MLLLTQPWHGSVDGVGVLFALGAAACWAAYILLTQHVGDNVTGLQGMGVSIPVAALVATVVAGPSTIPVMTWQLVAIGFGLALLLPVVPFTLEYLALRRLDAGVFGTLMSLEPALALLIGWLFLSQFPGLLQAVGIASVVAAGIGAERAHNSVSLPPQPDRADRRNHRPTSRTAPEPAGMRLTARCRRTSPARVGPTRPSRHDSASLVGGADTTSGPRTTHDLSQVPTPCPQLPAPADIRRPPSSDGFDPPEDGGRVEGAPGLGRGFGGGAGFRDRLAAWGVREALQQGADFGGGRRRRRTGRCGAPGGRLRRAGRR